MANQFKILIVDDEIHMRFLLTETIKTIKDDSICVFTAEDGEKALSICNVEKPDIVFLDVTMPKINGFDVCKEIKANNELNNPYVVILTAKGQESDKRKGRESAADLYITKPFDPLLIVEKINEVISHKQKNLKGFIVK